VPLSVPVLALNGVFAYMHDLSASEMSLSCALERKFSSFKRLISDAGLIISSGTRDWSELKFI
jgi:hypothetical protein